MLVEKNEILEYLKRKESKIYNADQLGREIVRECGAAIKELHAGNISSVCNKKKGLKKKIDILRKVDKDEESIAFQEYAELCIITEIYKRLRIPLIKEVGVNKENYILGLLDATGEIKRYMYNLLMKEDIKKAKQVFLIMDGLFSDMAEFYFSDRVLPSFRSKQDVFRIQLEQARAEMLRWI